MDLSPRLYDPRSTRLLAPSICPALSLSGIYWNPRTFNIELPSVTSRLPSPPMSPPRISKLPPVSLLFERKKAAIISSLSTPDEDYTDLSPKGSVDAGIRSLIDQINNIDGVVTTSSCAGRISVFLEGVKKDALQGHDPNEQTTVPGGKGMGGKWLFVSHDPVDVPLRKGDGDAPITDMLGSRPQEDALLEAQVDPDARFVKLQFEPMVSSRP